MRVSYPRKCGGNGNSNENIREDSHNQNSVMILSVVNQDGGNSKYKPQKTRRRTSRVYAAKVL